MKAAILLANGFEEAEALVTIDICVAQELKLIHIHWQKNLCTAAEKLSSRRTKFWTKIPCLNTIW